MPEKPNLVSIIRPCLQDPVYIKYLGLLGASNVLHLDVGAGTGENIRYATSLGLRSVALEYDHDYALRIHGDCVQGSAKYLPFTQNSFDVVTLTHVLEHLPYYEDALNEIHRVLKSRGIFIVEVPNKYYLQELFNYFYTHLVVDEAHRYLAHCNYFTYSSLKRLLETHGFSIKDFKVYGGLFHGTFRAVIQLFFDILLKGIIHGRRQDEIDSQRIEVIQSKLDGFYHFLHTMDARINRTTIKFVEVVGFVCEKT
jgi:SAM-dependent methyltransferase